MKKTSSQNVTARMKNQSYQSLDSMNMDPTKTRRGWKEKLVDLFGQRCCWNMNEECFADCQNIWRCWICLASFYTLVFSVFQFAFLVHIFLPYSDNESNFVADKMRKLFILSDNMFPVWTLATTVSTFFLSIWSLVFCMQPDKGKSVMLIAYKMVSSLIVLGCFILAIVQIVLCIIEWPDEKYKLELERVMRNDMEFGRPPDLIRKSWVDTQDAFQCCGIYSWNDWFTVSSSNRNHSHSHGQHPTHEKRELELPLSCCSSEHDFCVESKVWKIGCLEEQVYEMKTYSLFNTLFIYILYFLTNWLSLSIQKYFKKFPPKESTDVESPEYKGNSHNSSKLIQDIGISPNSKILPQSTSTSTSKKTHAVPSAKFQNEVGVGGAAGGGNKEDDKSSVKTKTLSPSSQKTQNASNNINSDSAIETQGVVNVEGKESKFILAPRKFSSHT